MTQKLPLIASQFLFLTLCLQCSQSLHAQSGSVTRGSTTRSSTTRSLPTQSSAALGGFCPVCILDMRQWVRGSSSHSVDYDGKRYLFPSDEQKQKFLKNPAKYVPALGGDCVVCAVEGNARHAGNVYSTAIHKGRLYLFPSDDEKGQFMADPTKYENADLAFDGQCSVCRVEMAQNVPGKPQFTSVYEGMRYYFPGTEQQRMFLANPKKYAVEKKK